MRANSCRMREGFVWVIFGNPTRLTHLNIATYEVRVCCVGSKSKISGSAAIVSGVNTPRSTLSSSTLPLVLTVQPRLDGHHSTLSSSTLPLVSTVQPRLDGHRSTSQGSGTCKYQASYRHVFDKNAYKSRILPPQLLDFAEKRLPLR